MDLLTQQEAASMLGVSVQTIRRFRLSGRLKTVKLSYRSVRIPKLDVERLIEGSRWNRNPQDYCKSQMENGMSFTQTMAEAKEEVYGRQIYKSQKSGFMVG